MSRVLLAIMFVGLTPAHASDSAADAATCVADGLPAPQTTEEVEAMENAEIERMDVRLIQGKVGASRSQDTAHVRSLPAASHKASTSFASQSTPARQSVPPEFVEQCPTSACCDLESFVNGEEVTTSSPQAGITWYYLYGGWEIIMPANVTILEEVPAIAHGKCATFNRELLDNSVHTELVRTQPASCAHGTAFRVTDAGWATIVEVEKNDFPGYEPEALNITLKTGQRVSARTIRHATPFLHPDPRVEEAPTTDYVECFYPEMLRRSYCPAFVAKVAEHLTALGVPMDSVDSLSNCPL